MKFHTGFLTILLSVAFLASAHAGPPPQNIFRKCKVSGTVFSEDSFGKREAQPLTKKRVFQLCGIGGSFDDYQLVFGNADVNTPTQRTGVFVVRKDTRSIVSTFIEFPGVIAAGDGANAVQVGQESQKALVVVKCKSILGSASSNGTLLAHGLDSFQFVGGINDNGSPKLIFKCVFTLGGQYSSSL